MVFTFSALVNQKQSTITADMTDVSPAAGANQAVDSTTGIPPKGYALIGTEIIYYDSIVDPQTIRIGPGGRGALGSTAAAHASGDPVFFDVIVNVHVNELRAKFDSSMGHQHSGAADDAPTLPESAVTNLASDLLAKTSTSHTHDAGTGNGPKLAQANTHQSPDTDSATSSLHHTVGGGANQAAAGNHGHAESAITNLTTDLAAKTSTSHTHDASGSNGPKLAQANTHQSPDTDAGPTSLHHTLGSGADQASAGNHSHAAAGSTLLHSDGTSVTANQGTSPTTDLMTYVLPANTVADGKGLHILLSGTYYQGSGSGSIVHNQLRFGSTVIADATGSIGSNANSGYFTLDIWVFRSGANGLRTVRLCVARDSGGTYLCGSFDSGTLDFTVDQTITVRMSCQTSTVAKKFALVELLN